jgi:aminoglycoside phosphotransferase (APT) family kinase protein
VKPSARLSPPDGQALGDARRAWIEEVAGGRVVGVTAIPGGGRIGFLVDVDTVDGRLELFVQCGRPDVAMGGASFSAFDREAEVYRALEPLGVPIPHVWGVSEQHNALLVDRAKGQTWFHPPSDPAQQVLIAQDFIAQLATWHSTPASELDLPSFGVAGGIREHQQLQVEHHRQTFQEQDRKRPIDPLSWYLLELLETRLPDENSPAVLVQGDTGPGNFMYLGNKVTAVIDWELAHLGDPMDDIAWLSWRTVQHSFPDFPTRMREYERLSGHRVDEQRVRYYRLNAFARLGPYFGVAPMTEDDPFRVFLREAASAEASPQLDRALDGSVFLMNALHRRMRLEALFDVLGTERPSREVDDEAEPTEFAVFYDVVLRQLKDIAERVDDRLASTQAKGAARQVKFLKELYRNGAHFDAQELDQICGLVGRRIGSLEEGRAALVAAVTDRKVTIDDYLLYHWNRLRHDDHLMRHASGALYTRTWPELR